MATFASVDALIASLPARPAYIEKESITVTASAYATLWRAPGRPGLGEKPGALAGLACSRLTQGAGTFFPTTGGKKNHLFSLMLFRGSAGNLQLVDRIWHSDSLSLNNAGAQPVNSVALPARAGTGVGLELGFEIWSAGGGSAINPTASYTDPVNGATRTATLPANVPASAAAARFFPFTLQTGDTGVSSIQSCTTGLSGSAGEGGLVLYRTIFENVVPVGTVALNAGPAETGLIQIDDDACLFLIDMPGTTSTGKVRLTYFLNQAVPVP
jgi:hypothetical protein